MLSRSTRWALRSTLGRIGSSTCGSVSSYGRVAARALHVGQRSEISEYFGEPQSFSASQPSGLFGIAEVDSPRGLDQFAQKSLQKAVALSELAQNEDSPRKDFVMQLDVLSDVICKVVDMAGFVRMVHPDPKMLQASQKAHEQMFDFMNYLNTSQPLYHRVSDVLASPEIRNNLSREEVRVAEILKHDFEKSGIQFSDQTRQDFIKSSSLISVLGQDFLNNIGPGVPSVSFANKAELDGLDPLLLNRFTSFTGKVSLPMDGQLVEVALQTVHSSEARQKLWRAVNSATPDQVQRLTEVLKQRYNVARYSGYDSYGAYELSDKMMKTPENVHKFLTALLEQVRPGIVAESKKLMPGGTMMPWDHSYYAAKQASSKKGRPTNGNSASTYFALGDVLQGISDICETLYGIRFVPGSVRQGEVWDPEVRRLDVYEGANKVGIIYCDLFSREGKSPNPAHFTIQCSRQVWPWERDYEGNANLETTVAQDGQISKHQLPMIVLICDFIVQNGHSYLTLHEVQTLFHEMGHAIHSMIGRTDLHNVGGTRCATDFVELPSILMEKFASSPTVLSMLARDRTTGKQVSTDFFRRNKPTKSSADWELYHQVMLSLYDQALHTSAAGAADFSPDAVVQATDAKHSIYKNVSSQYYAQFGHLISYGSTYYSYLLDRGLANLVWSKFFEKDPLSEASGEAFKKSVLSWGGSRDATECTEELLGSLDYSEVAKHVIASPGTSMYH